MRIKSKDLGIPRRRKGESQRRFVGRVALFSLYRYLDKLESVHRKGKRGNSTG